MRDEAAQTDRYPETCHEVHTDQKDLRVFLSEGVMGSVIYKDSSNNAETKTK